MSFPSNVISLSTNCSHRSGPFRLNEPFARTNSYYNSFLPHAIFGNPYEIVCATSIRDFKDLCFCFVWGLLAFSYMCIPLAYTDADKCYMCFSINTTHKTKEIAAVRTVHFLWCNIFYSFEPGESWLCRARERWRVMN